MVNNNQEFFEITLKNGIKIPYKNFDKVSGMMAVYIIINSINSKVYIGSTVDVCKRRCSHFGDLNNNRHSNKHLQNAYNKYDKNAFNMYLLEYVEDKDVLLIREQYWIDLSNVVDKNVGYNNSPSAMNSLGVIHSEESKKLRSIFSSGESNPFYGKKHSKETLDQISNANSKPIFQFDLKGNFIKEWKSATEIQSVERYSRNCIYNCCHHKVQKHKGYLWFYKEESEQEDFNIQNFIPKPYFNRNKSIYQCDLEGNIIKEWYSIGSASKELNLQKQRIIMCCKGKLQTYKGFIWKYKLT
jgi:group I intron endonuclease